ncbi:MAG: hypothetical protein Q8K70_04930 [Bacteroidota bacterium]|nr:hypothetical protein [Bacteroidota bacterium]
MNSEIKILFYIIIGIIYFISRVYNKEKKKENQRQPNKKPVGGQTAEEIFRELRKQLNLPEEPKSVVPKRVKATPEPFIPNNETGKRQKLQKEKLVLNRTLFKRKDIISSNSTENESNDIQSEKYNKSQHELLRDFDGRKAVIFSEILKRPQY